MLLKEVKKHPDRWRRAVLCRTADAIPGMVSGQVTDSSVNVQEAVTIG